ncbi:bifunctional hydroxymethylpyrimidine kinase/phosphomethylpyrimidine kinase [Enterococcus montenegrensis]|uniref:bifunctional hydroxymethylpyrimidine kinase/phosphomethylpyrimidine kinase n=1 Tax=Enterococcus montenegrensis TaxID=3031993 RepID=UPI00249DB809|nr:bifunctional hydroxymethylpyrimidine kinase/phosphomethylpyrimidine kinase [Enterococcus montenegrensis]WHA09510.1 bifunctional hydroxymethylpyrimidine kinase/phosphomethylpyrimidine kinase [Enterococcus montenegrensis]
MKKVLTIAGSDSTGGAGLEADLKTFEEYGVFGFASITSIVTMDPKTGWSHEVTELPAELLLKQLISAFAGADMAALKTGMMGNDANILAAVDFLDKQQVENIVVDPVIACKGTAQILQPEVVTAIKKYLLPLATITTPNLVEAGILAELGDLSNLTDMKKAARAIWQQGAKNVVIKGGHRLGSDKAIDLFYDGAEFVTFENELYQTDFNHGAGCTFAAAVTAGLAKGAPMKRAVAMAKQFVAAAIKEGVQINPYVGHVWHGAYNKAQKRMEAIQ